MKNLSKYIIYFVLLVSAFYFWNTKNNDANNTTEHPASDIKNQTVDSDEQELEQIKKTISQKISNKKTLSGLMNDGTKYVRKYPKYDISHNVYREIGANFYDMDQLQASVDKIKQNLNPANQAEYESKYEKVWDLGKKPSNDTEYKSMLAEMELYSLHKISTGIETDNIAQIQLYIAAIQAKNLLSAFDMTGSGDGVPTFQLKPTIVANIEKINKRLKKNRKVAAQIESKEEVQKAMDLLEKTNPNFFTNFNNQTEVDEYYKREDEVTDYLTRLFMGISEFMATAKVFPDLMGQNHLEIFDLTEKIFDDANNSVSDENRQETMSDYSYEVYSKAFAFKRARTSALITGAVVAFSEGLTALVTEARHFGINMLAAFTPEAIITGYNCFHGTINLYKLHLYHSQLSKENEYRTIIGEREKFLTEAEFLSKELAYTVNKANLDEVMRMQINKSWAWGFMLGYGVANTNRLPSVLTTVATKLGLMKTVGRVDLLALGIKGLINTPKTILNGFKWGMARASDVISGSPPKKGINLIFEKVSKTKKTGKLLSGLFKMAGGLGLIAADSLFSAVLSYQLVYTRMHSFSDFINQIYLSPDMAIALTQLNEEEKTNFIQATRTLFYPVCNHYANYKVRKQFARSDSKAFYSDEIKSIRRDRTLRCLALIYMFENSDDDMRTLMKNIEQKNYNLEKRRLFEAYYNDKPFKENEIYQLQYNMSTFPNHYKIVWLSALRSIYPLKGLPTYYYDIKNILIYQREEPAGFISSVFQPDLSTTNDSTRKNLANFNYFLDYFSYLLCKETKIDNPEYCEERVTSIKDSKGQDLVGEYKNINMVAAYKIIWQNSRDKGLQANEALQNFLIKREQRTWYQAIWDSTKSGLDELWWALSDFMIGPEERDFNYNVLKYANLVRGLDEDNTVKVRKKGHPSLRHNRKYNRPKTQSIPAQRQRVQGRKGGSQYETQEQ